MSIFRSCIVIYLCNTRDECEIILLFYRTYRFLDVSQLDNMNVYYIIMCFYYKISKILLNQ